MLTNKVLLGSLLVNFDLKEDNESSLLCVGPEQSTCRTKKLQSCPTLCNTMDCSLPGFSVHGIFQATKLEWVAFPFSRGSSRPRDRTRVSHIAGRCFTVWSTREAWRKNEGFPQLKNTDFVIASINMEGLLPHHKGKWSHHFTNFFFLVRYLHIFR